MKRCTAVLRLGVGRRAEADAPRKGFADGMIQKLETMDVHEIRSVAAFIESIDGGKDEEDGDE
ncbi:MAG: hypothetical protein LBU32_04990 [Clostridiales bacterium]|nr:hypothetical protein [Clostridiales bacterium]